MLAVLVLINGEEERAQTLALVMECLAAVLHDHLHAKLLQAAAGAEDLAAVVSNYGNPPV